MKSLRESLFDKDLVAKGVSFGDYYEYLSMDKRLTRFFKDCITRWSKKILLKDTGESEPDMAIIKIILSISMVHSKDFQEELKKILTQKYWKAGYDPIIKVSSNNNPYYVDDVLDKSVNSIIVSFNGINLPFRRK